MEIDTFALVWWIQTLFTILKNPGAMVMPHIFGHSFIIGVGPKFITKKLIQRIFTFIVDVILILILFYLI